MQPIELPRVGESSLPQILVRPLYHADDPMKVVGYESVDFVPGIIIERCGRQYEVQKNGSQRRVK